MKSTVLTVFIAFLNIVAINDCNAQCAMHTIINDSYEYNTPCPDATPNCSYTIVPQSYQVHSGATSLYLNFVNYSAGANTGVNAGDTVYVRKVAVCKNVPMQISAWLRTTFSGGHTCNMHLSVVDNNNNILANTDSMALPFPSWFQYQSGIVTPSTDTIKFIMITNVAGGNGNDLSFDDMLVEQCSDMVSGGLSSDTSTCNKQSIIITARNGYTNYLWSDSSAAQSLFITNNTPSADTLTYTVTFNDTMNCAYSDTVTIYFEDCTDIKTISEKKVFEVYPNPSNGSFFISGNFITNNSILNLYDLTGKQVASAKIYKQAQQLSFVQLSKGSYFYALYDNENIIARGKLVFN